MTCRATLALGLLVAGARPALAAPAPGPVVWDLDLVGVRSVDAGELLDRLATGQRRLVDRIPLVGTPLLYMGEEPRLDEAALEVDKLRIEAYYRERGYYGARVTSQEIVPLDPGRVRVVLRVEEGPAVVVREVEVIGLAAAPEAQAKLRELPLKPGGVFTEAAYDATRERILSALLEEGYATATVEQAARVVPEDGSATARYRVEAGLRYRFGPILVSGTTAVPRDTIRRQAALEVKTGQVWKESRLLRAQARIFGLGVFGGVRVGRGKPDPEKGTIPVVVAVREAPFRTVRAGPGIGVESTRWEARALAGWTHRNAFGELQRLSLDGRAGYAWLPNPWETTRESMVGAVVAEFYQPSAVSDRIDLSLRTEGERGLEPAYDFWSLTGRVGLPVRLAPRWSFVPSYNAEFYLVNGDLAAGTEESELSCEDDRCFLTYFEQRIRWDGVDDPLDPTRGVVASLSLQEGFPIGQYGYAYVRVLPELRAYWSPAPRTVLAVRFRVGALVPVNADSAPPVTARFLGGGPGSMRGFNTTRLAPYALDSEGGYAPVGGNGIADGSVELRLALTDGFGAALYVDAGSVSDYDPSPSTWQGAFDGDYMQWAAGVGLRWATPVGPLRVDLALRIPTQWGGGRSWAEGLPPLRGLPEGQNEPVWTFHVSLGDSL